MVQRRTCSFCGNPIEPGTGTMFIKRDATVYHFCSSKCKRNLLELRRIPRTVPWTQRARRRKTPTEAPIAEEPEAEKPVEEEAPKPRPRQRRARKAKKAEEGD